MKTVTKIVVAVIASIIAVVAAIILLTIWAVDQPLVTPSDCITPPKFVDIEASASSARFGLFGLDEEGKVWNKMANGCWTEL